jgi:hypothetical protein
MKSLHAVVVLHSTEKSLAWNAGKVLAIFGKVIQTPILSFLERME